jgi:hypothetical protein
MNKKLIATLITAMACGSGLGGCGPAASNAKADKQGGEKSCGGNKAMGGEKSCSAAKPMGGEKSCGAAKPAGGEKSCGGSK